MPFVHIDGNGAATRFAPQDERLISNARMRGDRSVRVTDVQLPNGQILQFEVRFDTNATSKRWHTPPTSGMIQVNLRNDNTRLVEYRLEEDQLTAGRKAVSAAADTRAAGEPELEPELEPEPEREPEPDADRSLWECSFEETWKPYSDDIQAKLRAAYAADPTSTCHFEETRHFPAKGRYQAKTETFKYSVDFSAGPDFRQLNLKSNKERPVRRLGCWCRTPDARAAADSAPLRILCIDGGGSKGLVPAIIMQRIEQMCAPHRVDELFDVVAGTSTGGILALGTCIARVPAAEMAKVYETRADEIWTKKGGLTGFLSPVAAKASYDAQKLECILKEYSVTPRPTGGYGGGAGAAAAAAGRQLRMDEPHPGAPKTFVVAAKEGEAAAEPFTQFLFRSYASPAFGGTEGRSDCEVWQAGRATSAAPTYFDPYEVGSESYVDGGVLANNPVQVAIDEAQDLYPQRRIGLVVSLGCGITQREYDHKAGGGMAGEVRKFASQLTSTEPFHRKVLESLRVISSGAGSVASLQQSSAGDSADPEHRRAAAYGGYSVNPRNQQFAQCLYVRLNPPLADDIAMDTKSAEDLATLRSATERWLDEMETVDAISRMVERIQTLERSTEDADTAVEEGVPPTPTTAPNAAAAVATDAEPEPELVDGTPFVEPEPEPAPEPNGN